MERRERKAEFNVSFDLYNEKAVRKLQEEDPDLLPDYAVNSAKDLAYNKQQVNSAIESAILNGKSVDKIAEDLQDRMENVNERSAIKMARTAVTSAQNNGTLDSFYDAQEMGIDIQKEWESTLDDRTRPSHRELDGERRDLDEKFSNGLQYPGDPSGNPDEIYWCRCTLVSYMPDVEIRKEDERITYDEWIKSKEESEQTDRIIPKTEPYREGTWADARRNETKADVEKWEDEYYSHNSNVSFTKKNFPNTYKYTTSAFKYINSFLRDEETYSGSHDEMENLVSGISAEMGKTSLKEDMICWRGDEDISYITGTGSSYADAVNAIGKTFTQEGFLSTSVYKKGAFPGIKSEYEIPKDTRSIYCGEFSMYKSEKELLVDHGTTCVVTDVVGDESNFMLKIRVISQRGISEQK